MELIDFFYKYLQLILWLINRYSTVIKKVFRIAKVLIIIILLKTNPIIILQNRATIKLIIHPIKLYIFI